MRKLLTGYATVFNRRHKRYGHLFQNRYKSIVCEEDAYFRKLVCYIHLNPLRAGIVKSLDELDCYRWGSHAVIMRTIGCTWLNRDYVLHYFGDEEESAVNFYRRCVEEEHNLGQQPLLVGGGLIRSTGGWSEVKSLKSRGEKRYFDERILGGSDFVKSMLEQADESVKGRIPADGNLQAAIDDLSSKCVQAGILISALQSGSRRRECSELRKRLAEMLVKDYGLSYAETARQLGISTSAVNQIFFRLKQQ
jgi:hypothetical protein